MRLEQDMGSSGAGVEPRPATLTEAEGRHWAMIAALPDPVLITTPAGAITEYNDAAAALFGAGRLAGTATELLPFVATRGTENGPWSGAFVNAAGQQADLEVRRARLANGQFPASDVYVVHDVSRWTELERLREQLLYDVAHELRSPLAVLYIDLEIIASDYAELSALEFNGLVASARRTATRLHDLMEGLLSAGNIQSGRFHVSPRPMALAPVVAEAVAQVEPTTAARGQQVLHECGDVDAVVADPRSLCQVLVNLLTNASKYGPGGEPIRLRCERRGKNAWVAVEDRGPGIPVDQQARLFDRFYRVRASGEQRGVGLGLGIARAIIEAHGGEIGVESEAQRGTRIWFTVPIVGQA